MGSRSVTAGKTHRTDTSLTAARRRLLILERTLRAHLDALLAEQGQTRRVFLMGDMNDEPDAATTLILDGSPGSEIGSVGFDQPDQGDGDRDRMWTTAELWVIRAERLEQSGGSRTPPDRESGLDSSSGHSVSMNVAISQYMVRPISTQKARQVARAASSRTLGSTDSGCSGGTTGRVVRDTWLGFVSVVCDHTTCDPGPRRVSSETPRKLRLAH